MVAGTRWIQRCLKQSTWANTDEESFSCILGSDDISVFPEQYRCCLTDTHSNETWTTGQESNEKQLTDYSLLFLPSQLFPTEEKSTSRLRLLNPTYILYIRTSKDIALFYICWSTIQQHPRCTLRKGRGQHSLIFLRSLHNNKICFFEISNVGRDVNTSAETSCLRWNKM